MAAFHRTVVFTGRSQGGDCRGLPDVASAIKNRRFLAHPDARTSLPVALTQCLRAGSNMGGQAAKVGQGHGAAGLDGAEGHAGHPRGGGGEEEAEDDDPDGAAAGGLARHKSRGWQSHRARSRRK